MKYRSVLIPIIILFVAFILIDPAFAHCDTMDGPVIHDAKAALASNSVLPVQKWIAAVDEPQIQAAFASTMKFRKLSPEAQEFADRFFFETVVRIHRQHEGAPFTGVKPAGTKTEPGVAEADDALAKGNDSALANELASTLTTSIHEKFRKALAAKEHANESSESGRAYVAAYVEYVHFVEKVATMLHAGHGHESAPTQEHHHE